MYLSLLHLDVRHPQVNRDLSDCQELHRTLMRAFPDGLERNHVGARAAASLLFRVGEAPDAWAISLLAQSRSAPDWGHLPTGYLRSSECKPLDGPLSKIRPGLQLRFCLRANVTRRVHARAAADADPARGRAAPEKASAVGHRVALRGESEQLNWLERQGAFGGFALQTGRLEGGKGEFCSTAARPAGYIRGRKGGGRLTIESTLFEGVLQVTDPERFRELVAQGIGPAKAYGCGLLSIAPIPA